MRRRTVLLLALAATPLAGGTRAAADGCAQDAGYAALAELVGEWEIVSDAGAVEGTAHVGPILDGCAFEEVRRRADGGAGRTLTFRDPVSGEWMQRWVSNGGDTARLALEATDEGLRVSGEMHTRDGEAVAVRAELAPRPGGGFRERLEVSLDGGATWEPPRITLYLPPGTAPPRAAESRPVAAAAEAPAPEAPAPEAPAPEAPAAPAPVATAPAPGVPAPAAGPQASATPSTPGVSVRSPRSAAQPPDATVMLESPMTLEVELGPLDALPDGTAWQTRQTAVYLAGDVRVSQVSATRRERRGALEIEVTVNLRTTAVQRRVDLEVELLAAGASVGRQRAENIALGKLIGLHDADSGRPVSLRFAQSAESFAALFADGRRPAARITVTVR